MTLLSRTDILSADDVPTQVEDVPEWGGKVRVRGLTAEQRTILTGTMIAIQGEPVDVRAATLARVEMRLIAACLIDDNGDRLFTDADAVALGQRNPTVISRLFRIARELSGIQDGAVEEAAGNSDAALSGDSSSG